MRPIAIFLVAVSCVAQSVSPLSSQSGLPLTEGSNGRLWRSIPADGKLFWLMAYHEGLKSALSASVASEPDAANRRGKYASTMKGIYPESLTWREVSNALDRFYNTSENGPIEISMALTIIAMKAVGLEESKIESATKEARRNATTPGPAPK